MSNRLRTSNDYKLNAYILKALLLLFLVSYAVISQAEEINYEALVKSNSATLKKVERNIAVKRYTEDNLPAATKEVAKIKSEALDCINIKNAELDKLNADLTSLGTASKAEARAVKKKRAELADEILKTEKLLASCRVFLLQTDEALKKLSLSQQELIATRLFAKGPDIISLILVNWNKPSLWISATQSFLLNNTGISLLSALDGLLLFAVFLIAFFAGKVVRVKINQLTSHKMLPDSFSNHFYRAFLAVTAYYAPYLLVSLSVAIYCYVLTAKISPIPFISVVAYGLPIYFILIALVEIFLKPRQPAEPIHNLPVAVFEGLCRRLKVFFLLLFIAYLLFTTLLTQSLPKETLLLARGILVVFFILNLIWAVRILGAIPRFANTVILRFGVSLILLSVFITELLGYRNLSGYIITGVFGSLIIFGLFLISSRFIKEFFYGLEKGKRKWQRYIRESLGVTTRKKLPELFWIRLVVFLGLWAGLAILLLKIWGLSEAGFQQITMILVDGFTVGSLKIIPIRILFALITLTLLLAVSRWFRSRLEQSWLKRTNMDRGAREAVATISGYTGVAVALLSALSITGVEFANLALIAGALSVGIGFGLQNIVNNFVSGLILLFERPIKTGDWIVVGNTEGYVKKISIRSTQIQTFDQADVIVPNSDLISGQVTNWMLRDVKGRITVPVGVAYGSDTLLVEKLLQEVAQLNPLVVNDGSTPEPKVLFTSFGDSALLFELRAFITNIDKRFQVTSELNFAIDEAFRKHGIQIPFPQRDLHIKKDLDAGPASEPD